MLVQELFYWIENIFSVLCNDWWRLEIDERKIANFNVKSAKK